MTGLSALVTGGASGIGLATARRLSELGASVAVLDQSVDELMVPLRGFRADVSDAAGVERAVAAAADALGAIDILVNNAGIVWCCCRSIAKARSVWQAVVGHYL